MNIEELAAKFHEIYQEEAKRQGDVRHKDNYDELSENIKEFDRVLARYVERLIAEKQAEMVERCISTLIEEGADEECRYIYKIRVLSPYPGLLDHERLKARLEAARIVQGLYRTATKCNVEEVREYIADLEGQLAVLEEPGKE